MMSVSLIARRCHGNANTEIEGKLTWEACSVAGAAPPLPFSNVSRYPLTPLFASGAMANCYKNTIPSV